MSKVRMLGAALALLGLGGGVGYAVGVNGQVGEDVPPSGPAVATFVGGQIGAQAVRERIQAEGPLMADTYATLAGRRELVQRMAREQVLLTEARRKGFHLRAPVVRQCDGAILEAFFETEFEAKERSRPVTDTELQAYFAAQKPALAQPARVRVGHIFLAAPEADVALRKRQGEAARALLSEARRALAREPAAFAALARRRSEDPRTRPLGGELPPMDASQLTKALGAPVAQAVFAPAAPSGVLAQVVEVPTGFHVVAVLERSAASEPQLAEVRELLQPQLLRERRSKAYDAFVAALEKQAQVQLDEGALNALAPAPAAAR